MGAEGRRGEESEAVCVACLIRVGTQMELEELERRFARWWAISYGTVPGPHARMTHAAFAKYVLEEGSTEEPEPAA